MEEGEAGEKSRSQTTENVLSIEDYLGDVNVVIFPAVCSVTPADLSVSFQRFTYSGPTGTHHQVVHEFFLSVFL